MPRRRARLTAAFVRSVSRPGVYCDQHGLRLRVYESRKLKSISKHWVWRGTVNGTRRDVGLGAFPYVPLADARQQAYEHRKIARAGGDPVALKRKPDVPTFAEAVETVIGIHREGWKDAGKSEKQWRASLRDYAMKRLGRKRVDQIAAADVMAVLIPHWHTKTETMRRVRQRIGAVMKWAVAQGYRDDNPAGDAISAALPKTGTVRKHQRALPFAEVGPALDKGEGVRRVHEHRPGARVPGADGLPVQRGPARQLGRGRSRIGDLDGPREPHEGEARSPGTALRARARNPPRSAGALGRLGPGLPLGARPGTQRQHDIQTPP